MDKQQATQDRKDEETWNNARHTMQGCYDYLTNFPSGKYIAEARQKIDEWHRQEMINQAARRDILDKIKKIPNLYSPKQILDFLSNDTITQADLTDCGIPQSVINNLPYTTSPRLAFGETPTEIPSGYTEVYFWGLYGSGITCALGALLNTAAHFGYLAIAPGPGSIYAAQLKNIFNRDWDCMLPAPTPVGVLQYLPFTLKKVEEKRPRYISLIEKCGGEILKCFFRRVSGSPQPSQTHEDTFNLLIRFLKSDNRKIHFFVIDYDKENRTDIEGLTLSDYLSATATFLNHNDIFRKTTDAIYVIVSKSDLMPCMKEERAEYAKRYLEENYRTFINVLESYCKKYRLNDLSIIPFSLGNVYFQQICDFDRESSMQILDILINRVKPRKRSILDILFK